MFHLEAAPKRFDRFTEYACFYLYVHVCFSGPKYLYCAYCSSYEAALAQVCVCALRAKSGAVIVIHHVVVEQRRQV